MHFDLPIIFFGGVEPEKYGTRATAASSIRMRRDADGELVQLLTSFEEEYTTRYAIRFHFRLPEYL